MAKFLCLIEGRTIKKYMLGKTGRPLTAVRSHLFRTDDKIFIHDRMSAESLLFYDLESTQPYSDGDLEVDSDKTMALIDIARTNGKRNVSVLGALSGLNPMTFIYIAIAGVILLSAVGLV